MKERGVTNGVAGSEIVANRRCQQDEKRQARFHQLGEVGENAGVRFVRRERRRLEGARLHNEVAFSGTSDR